jgi:hypothetical protein
MHKFVPRYRVAIFRNERTWSTPLDPKLMFGAFWTVSLLHELRCKMGRTCAINGQVCATKSYRHFFTMNVHDPSDWTPNSCFGVFLTILLLHESWCKTSWTGAINAQVCAMKSRLDFFEANAPNRPHWTPNSYFWSFQTVSLLHKHWCKRVEPVQLMHKFVQWSHVKIFQNKFTQSTLLEH